MNLTRIRGEATLDQFHDSVAKMSASNAPDLFVLQFTATAWGIGRVGGAPIKWFGGADPTQVFESRIFGADVDLRWVRQGSTGVVTGWFETEPVHFGIGVENDRHIWRDVELLPRRYLLWGNVDGVGPDGVSLSDGRVGRYEIPIKGSGRTVLLDTVEFLAPSVDGNVIVVAECLRGFSFEE